MRRLQDHLSLTACVFALGYGLLWVWQDGASLPLALHGVGLVASVYVAMRLVLGLLARGRMPKTAVPSVLPKAPWRARPRPPLRSVKPRTQFGLRGTQR